jgi:hypothetical protein
MYIYIYIHTQKHIHIYVCICMYVCMYIIQLLGCVCICVYVCVCVYVYIYYTASRLCMYVYINTHTHTHIYILYSFQAVYVCRLAQIFIEIVLIYGTYLCMYACAYIQLWWISARAHTHTHIYAMYTCYVFVCKNTYWRMQNNGHRATVSWPYGYETVVRWIGHRATVS